ncbi:envelope stress response membrane protein PspB [Aliidiomarina halalkaliphila]|uniref:Envelope stress response membrane protein PspB n=1 Tax=Aliidiomarina halalkaliphila TaxID=2593535 RepID=A0A552X660_9GAMM|nr:envelope stress response membrane protein PspB [Aliidiomarina halalkaliphila]TRW50514.1 envelope stress response membrane protein PspB [Aliidiomarina halalkaliphila]
MEVAVLGIIITPLILFVIFVAPIWVILHYRSKRKINEGMSQEDAELVRELAVKAEDMRDRIRTLESLLDAEHSNWRKDNR